MALVPDNMVTLSNLVMAENRWVGGLVTVWVVGWVGEWVGGLVDGWVNGWSGGRVS